MTHEHLLNVVSSLQRANSTDEGRSSLTDYFGKLSWRVHVYEDDKTLAGVMVEIECEGDELLFDTFRQHVYDIYGSGGYVYMPYELSMALQDFFVKYPMPNTRGDTDV